MDTVTRVQILEGTVYISPGTNTRGVMVKGLDNGIVVSEFELYSRYYVHFWTNTLAKGMNPLILLAMS